MPLEFDYQNGPQLVFPSKATVITRYMDLSKFLSMISTSTLFLTRLDLMEDKYEGRMMKKSYEDIKNWHLYIDRTGFFNTPEDPEEIATRNANEIKYYIDHARKTNLINCWSKYTAENYALWKIFAKTDTGIMIKSSINNLIKVLEKEPKKL